MKKLFAVLITAVMMAAGLVAASGTAAQAACPYSGCIPTYTIIDPPSNNKVKKGNRARVGVKVKAERGNATPKGRVTVRVVRNNGGFKYVESKQYTGGKVWFKTPKLTKRGQYTIFARYDRKPGSRWKDSNNTASFKVVKR